MRYSSIVRFVVALGFCTFHVRLAYATTTQPADLLTAANIVEAWKQTASEEGVSTQGIVRVEELLNEVLSKARIGDTRIRSVDYASSLRRLIRTNSAAYKPRTWQGGSAWFVAACTVDACTRPALSDGQRSHISESQRLFSDGCGKAVARSLQDSLPPESREHWRQPIEALSIHLQEGMIQEMAVLADDVLFPAFKTPDLPQDATAFVQGVLKELPGVPRYEDPDVMMQTKDEWYAQQLKSFGSNIQSRLIYELVTATVQQRFRRNEWWGPTLVGSSGVAPNSDWPAAVELRPLGDVRSNKEVQRPK